jgi:hypothetical protein
MFRHSTRRQFLRRTAGTAAAGTVLGTAGLDFLSSLPVVSASEANLPPQAVRLSEDIEPLVRLLEETPREQLLEAVAARIKQGTSYKEILAALLLAGVRNVQPRPEVGFKFHAVLVVNSAHLASLASPPEHRWLPIFWSLDYFKVAQAEDRDQGNWTMSAVEEAAVPDAQHAPAAFTQAMQRWDEPAADAAAAALARHLKPHEAFELFCRFAARDFRSIGHKAIFVSNAFRTLEHIGWQHAEPVLRSLAYALLKHEGTNPATADLEPDRPWRTNQARAAQLRDDWLTGRADPAAAGELATVLRTASAEDACDHVVQSINSGLSPDVVWDALFVSAGELLCRQPGIISLHALTTTNAIHYAFRTTQDEQMRRLLLLQNAAFLPMFRQRMYGRGAVGELNLLQLEPWRAAAPPSVEEIFADVGRNTLDAARKVIAYTTHHPDATELIDTARLLVFFKGNNSHDYKFSSAVLEDYGHLSPEWRARFLAASMFNLRGSSERDNPLVARTRAALAG